MARLKTVDVSRLKPFIVAPSVDVQAVAAADLGEAQVDAILAHRGSARKRALLEFQVQWSDGDVTWEPWERVKKQGIAPGPRSGFALVAHRNRAVLFGAMLLHGRAVRCV